jgi:hypothetical protein
MRCKLRDVNNFTVNIKKKTLKLFCQPGCVSANLNFEIKIFFVGEGGRGKGEGGRGRG